MSEYLCEVFLGNVNFTQNTPHRYLNISGHFNIKSAINSLECPRLKTCSALYFAIFS